MLSFYWGILAGFVLLAAILILFRLVVLLAKGLIGAARWAVQHPEHLATWCCLRMVGKPHDYRMKVATTIVKTVARMRRDELLRGGLEFYRPERYQPKAPGGVSLN